MTKRRWKSGTLMKVWNLVVIEKGRKNETEKLGTKSTVCNYTVCERMLCYTYVNICSITLHMTAYSIILLTYTLSYRPWLACQFLIFSNLRASIHSRSLCQVLAVYWTFSQLKTSLIPGCNHSLSLCLPCVQDVILMHAGIRYNQTLSESDTYDGCIWPQTGRKRNFHTKMYPCSPWSQLCSLQSFITLTNTGSIPSGVHCSHRCENICLVSANLMSF